MCGRNHIHGGPCARTRQTRGTVPFAALGIMAWSGENGLTAEQRSQILQTHEDTSGSLPKEASPASTVSSSPSSTRDDLASPATILAASPKIEPVIFWIGNIRWFLQYAGGMFRRYTTADGLPSPVVIITRHDRYGLLLALTSDGLPAR